MHCNNVIMLLLLFPAVQLFSMKLLQGCIITLTRRSWSFYDVQTFCAFTVCLFFLFSCKTSREPVPGVVRQDSLVLVLQQVPHLLQDVKPPVVQDLRQVGHAAHVHLLRCNTNSMSLLLKWSQSHTEPL